MNILYTDIKHTLLREFAFLKDHGFTDFAEEQLAYEIHFTCANEEGINIDVYFETISSTSINIMINGAHFHEISTHEQISSYYSKLAALYDDNFKRYLETNDNKFMNANFDLYLSKGRILNELFLHAVAGILKREPSLLNDPTHYQQIIGNRPQPVRPHGGNFHAVSLKELINKSNDPSFMKRFDDHWLFIETDKVEVDIYSPEEFVDLLMSSGLDSTNVDSLQYQFIKKQPL